MSVGRVVGENKREKVTGKVAGKMTTTCAARLTDEAKDMQTMSNEVLILFVVINIRVST